MTSGPIPRLTKDGKCLGGLWGESQSMLLRNGIVLSVLPQLGSKMSGANDDLHVSSLLRCTIAVNTLSRIHKLDL